MKRLKKTTGAIAIVSTLLSGQLSLASTNSCVNGSELWKWTEAREQRVEGTAKCKLNFHTNPALLNQDLPAIPDGALKDVRAFGSKEFYISQTEKSASVAEAEMADKLKDKCTHELVDYLQTINMKDYNRYTFMDLKLVMDLEPTGNGTTNSTYGYSMKYLPMGEAEKEKIQERLNEANSCSTFVTIDRDGNLQLSNCDQTGIGSDSAKELAQIRGTTTAKRIIMPIVVGAFSNLIRGGVKGFEVGSTQEARLLAGMALSTLSPLTTQKLDTPTLQFYAQTVARYFIATVVYKTGGMLRTRGPGAKGTGSVIAHGLLNNALFFGITCGLECLEVSPGATAAYVLADNAADRKYEIGGKTASDLSAAATGALLGLAYEEVVLKHFDKKYKTRVEIERIKKLLSVSSQDLCLDVNDIIPL